MARVGGLSPLIISSDLEPGNAGIKAGAQVIGRDAEAEKTGVLNLCPLELQSVYGKAFQGLLLGSGVKGGVLHPKFSPTWYLLYTFGF